MAKHKIRRDDKKLPVPAKLDRGDEIIAASKTNPNLTTETKAKVATFEATHGRLRQVQRDRTTNDEQSKAITLTMTSELKTWSSEYDDVADAVEVDTSGDAAKIATTGFHSFDPTVKEPAPPPPQPQNMSATTGDNAGEVDLSCDAKRGAIGYLWQVSADPNDETKFVQIGQSTKSSFTVKNQPAGTRQWFRCAIMATGEGVHGPWSDAALGIAH